MPEHLDEVRSRKLELIGKTEAAVKDRLTKEISYWDHRAEQLKLQEQAGKTNARLNSGEARKRADDLQGRLEKRMEEIKLRTADLAVAAGGAWRLAGRASRSDRRNDRAIDRLPSRESRDTQAAAARARQIVMEVERGLGFEPTDREFEKLGYDIESRIPGTGRCASSRSRAASSVPRRSPSPGMKSSTRSTSRTTSSSRSSSSTATTTGFTTCAGRSSASRISASPVSTTTLPS